MTSTATAMPRLRLATRNTMRTDVLSSPKISRKSSEAAPATFVLESGGTGCGHGMILIAGTAAYADCAYDFAAALQRNAARKNHDFPVV